MRYAKFFLIMMVLVTYVYGMNENQEPLDYVVDLNTIIFPNHNQSKKIIEQNTNISASLIENPFDLFRIGWSYCASIVTDQESLDKELYCKLNTFLKETPLPENARNTKTTVFIENRENKSYTESSHWISTFMCTQNTDEENFLRSYILEEFKKTENKHISELNTTLKHVLEHTLGFMFNTTYINKIMEIDTVVIDIIKKLSNKKNIALVHNMPKHVSLKNLNDEHAKKLYDLTQSTQLYTSGEIGTVTTDPVFYKNMPITEETTFITNCRSNTLNLKKENTFANFLIYNYTEPQNLKNELKLE